MRAEDLVRRQVRTSFRKALFFIAMAVSVLVDSVAAGQAPKGTSEID